MWNFSYDSHRRITTIRDIASQTVVLAYDNFRNLIKMNAQQANGFLVRTVSTLFDAHNRLVTINTGGSVLIKQLDNNGNITRQTDPNGTTTLNIYDYDAVNRLIASSDSQDGITRFAYDKNDQLTRVTAITYPDAAENVTFTYDGCPFGTDRLYQVFDNGVLTATYIYNGDGLRTRKVTAAGTFLYHYNQQGRLVSETREDGTPIRDYIWQDNEPVAQIDVRENAESLRYFHTDHLTTPRLAIDANGMVVWRWKGEAFGQTLANEDPDGNGQPVVVNLRYPGQYYDQETGLHYNYFRYYDPSIGRYITSDPSGLVGGLNLYAYVNGNSIRFQDSFGLFDAERGDNLIYPPSANCSFVNDCVKELNEILDSDTPLPTERLPRDKKDAKGKAKDKVKGLLKDFVKEILKRDVCAAMNSCACNNGKDCDDPKPWLPSDLINNSSGKNPDDKKDCE